jgi:hypothetical protein
MGRYRQGEWNPNGAIETVRCDGGPTHDGHFPVPPDVDHWWLLQRKHPFALIVGTRDGLREVWIPEGSRAFKPKRSMRSLGKFETARQIVKALNSVLRAEELATAGMPAPDPDAEA